MLQKTIPLRGDRRALLRLHCQDPQDCHISLEPPLLSGCLFLAGETGQIQPVPLAPDGSAALSLDFIPLGALVYDGDGFPLSGGFAGRQALLDQVQVAVRLHGLPQPIEPPPISSFHQPDDASSLSGDARPEPQASHGEASADAGPEQAEAQIAQAETSPAASLSAPAAQQDQVIPSPLQGEAEPQQTPKSAPSQETSAAPPQEQQGDAAASSRQQSPVLLDILQRAQALFAAPESQPAPAPQPQPPAPVPVSNPFPRAFPQSVWKRVEYPGRPGHYLVGEGMGRNGAYTVYALPGVYAPVSRQPGFCRFLRAADGSGYWIRIVPRKG